jgi:hypothetical protein
MDDQHSLLKSSSRLTSPSAVESRGNDDLRELTSSIAIPPRALQLLGMLGIFQTPNTEH